MTHTIETSFAPFLPPHVAACEHWDCGEIATTCIVVRDERHVIEQENHACARHEIELTEAVEHEWRRVVQPALSVAS